LDRIFRDPDGRVAYHYVLVDFLCHPKEGELKPDSDAADARFVPLQELSFYSLPPHTLAVIQRADRIRRHHEESPSAETGFYDG